MLFSPKAINFSPGVWAQGGSGVSGNFFPWYAAPFIDITPATYANISAGYGLSLGDYWWNNGTQVSAEGNAFMFVKANAALTIGQLVSMDAPQTGTYTTAGSTASKTVTNITEAGAVNSEIDNWLTVIATGQSVPQARRIKANTTGAAAVYTISLPDFLRPNSPNDQDVWTTTPTNGDQLAIVRPYNVKVCTAALQPIGVALGTVTSGDYTIIQIAGLAGVSCVGNTLANVAMVPGSPGAAGVLTGQPANYSAAQYFNAGGSIVPLMANAAASAMVMCMVNFVGA